MLVREEGVEPSCESITLSTVSKTEEILAENVLEKGIEPLYLDYRSSILPLNYSSKRGVPSPSTALGSLGFQASVRTSSTNSAFVLMEYHEGIEP